MMSAGALTEKGLPWLALLRFRQTWGVVVAKFLSDAAWYFYLFWLPKYLYDARGFDIKAVATFAWIPPLAAGIGCLVGGSLSSYLLRRQLALDHARKIALGASGSMRGIARQITAKATTWKEPASANTSP